MKPNAGPRAWKRNRLVSVSKGGVRLQGKMSMEEMEKGEMSDKGLIGHLSKKRNTGAA